MLSRRSISVPVAGGELSAEICGPSSATAAVAVVLLHDLSSNAVVWRLVSARLDPSILVVAPDQRGRGASSALPEPFGMTAHLDDVIAMLDHLRVDVCVVVGHGYGAAVAANLARAHPDRVGACVLVGGGLPRSPLEDPNQAIDERLLPVLADLRATVSSRDDALEAARRRGSAMGPGLDVLDASTLHELAGGIDGIRRRTDESAVWFDGSELLLDPNIGVAVFGAGCPLELVVAGDAGAASPTGGVSPTDAADLEREIADLSAVIVPGLDHQGLLLNPQGADAVARAANRALGRLAART